MKLRNFLAIFSLFLLSMPLIANDFMELHKIQAEVNTYLNQQYAKATTRAHSGSVKIITQKIDPRLKLAKCDNVLTFKKMSSTANRANVAVKVSCDGPSPWSIFINNRIEYYQPVAVLADALPKGHTLTLGDILMVEHDIFQLRTGYITNPTKAVGQELKRGLRHGEVLRSYQLKAPTIVKKGDAVVVEATYGSLSVVAPGIALADGREGQQIRVENRRSSRIIRAEIIGPGRVKVNM